MEDDGISSLRPTEAAPPLHVRVIRKWVPGYRPNETHFLFVNNQAIGIQAMVKGNNRDTVKPKLSIGRCYRIEQYACINPDNFTNTLTHPAFIIFGSAAKITSTENDLEIPTQYFEIASRRRAELQATYEGIIDYIGILRGIKDKTTVKNEPYVVLSLRDTSNQDVTIVVWKQVCTVRERFNRQEIENATPPIIIALTALKAKRQTGNLQLQTTNATYVYLNPEIMDTQTLRNMYQDIDLTIPAVIPIIENNISIAELIQMPLKDITGKNFTIKGSVLDINVDKGWYYTGCVKCGQLVYKAGPVWYCPTHANFDDAKFMYCIQTPIEDASGVLHGTIFDNAARQLLELPCREMLKKENHTELMQNIKKKEAKLQIQAERDVKTGVTRCTVNNAIHLDEQASSSSTPITPTNPETPAQIDPTIRNRESTAKRQLFDTKGPEEPATKKASK